VTIGKLRGGAAISLEERDEFAPAPHEKFRIRPFCEYAA
jgi:hypothetical protein